MKIKKQELSGAALDWAVARAEEGEDLNPFWHPHKDDDGGFRPSTNWNQGGPIIEREGLGVGRKHQCDPAYCELNDPAVNHWARTSSGGFLSYGPTPLIAAMRCFCAAKLGDEVDIPKELLK